MSPNSYLLSIIYKKGLHRFSSAMVVVGPWPDAMTVSSGNGKIFSWMLLMSCAMSPPMRSVRPTLPLKMVSPLMSNPLCDR